MDQAKSYKCLHCGNEDAKQLFLIEECESVLDTMKLEPVTVLTRAIETAKPTDFRCEKCQESDEQ